MPRFWTDFTPSVFIYQLFWTQACTEGMCTTGLRSHARCHPYPIPQPVKVGHSTGVYNPYSFRIVMWVPLPQVLPTRTNQWKCCETEPTDFRPYPRRLESLTICRCHYKGSNFFSVIQRPWALVQLRFEPTTSQYGISVAESQTFLLAKLPPAAMSEEKCTMYVFAG